MNHLLWRVKNTVMERRFKYIYRIAQVLLLSIVGMTQLNAQTLAFPGAEGFGAYSMGGRGGDVYTVTNINDSGPGSLRYGIDNANGPRTIVFAVSGLIQLKSGLSIDKDYITIAGQTAPGDGICLRDNQLSVKADHVIVRYIRSRLGDEAGNESDAISISGGHNIILDHCSASWSVDECFSCSTGDPNKIDNVSVQWSIISEALNNSIHSKGPHSYGALIRGCYGAKYSYHHNLFAHNKSRNPRPGNYDKNTVVLDPEGLQFDFRNNVMYNWNGSRPGYDADTDSRCRYNYVGNYGKPGPNSNSTGHAYSAGSIHFRAYYEDNYFFGQIPENQWSLVSFGSRFNSASIAAYKMTEPFSTGPIITQDPLEAYAEVMAHAGASLVRDTVDARVISEVQNGTGKIIDDEDEVGSWPVYNTYGVKTDTDLDGMPDAWETENGLNPNDPSDRNDDRNDDGYTNLEEYLYSLVDVYTSLKPVVTLVSPVSESGYLPADSIFVKAFANTFGLDTIVSIDLFLDEVLVSSYASSIIDTILIGLTTGAHYVKVMATDQGGNTALDSSKIYAGSALFSISDSVIGEGSISIDPPGGSYVESTEVTVQANPDFPFFFDGWTGDTISTENTLELVISKDLELIANFKMDSSAVLNVNFQPKSTTEIPEGYFPDYGDRYTDRGNGQTYGWVGKDNFETRQRSHADLRLATLNHMQKSGSISWEIKLDNGYYIVNLFMGDAENTDQVNSIDVEGIQVIDESPNTGYFDEYVVEGVSVADGNLTLKPIGDNAKLNYIRISKISGNYLLVNGGSGTGEYEPGTVVNITADEPETNWVFTGWTGDVSHLADSTSSTTSVTIPEGIISVSASYKDLTGIWNKVAEPGSITLYPNPANSDFSVELKGIENARIEIYNLMGSMVYDVRTKTRENIYRISDHNLTPGVYLIRVIGSSLESYTQKLLIE